MNERRNTLLGTTGLTHLLTPAGEILDVETRVISQDTVSYQIGFWAYNRARNEREQREALERRDLP